MSETPHTPRADEPRMLTDEYPWPKYHRQDCALSCGYDLGSEENNCTCGAVQERKRSTLAPQGDDARERLAAELCWIDGINNLYVVSDPRGVMDFWRGASEEVRREWRHAADRILALLSLPLEESR